MKLKLSKGSEKLISLIKPLWRLVTQCGKFAYKWICIFLLYTRTGFNTVSITQYLRLEHNQENSYCVLPTPGSFWCVFFFNNEYPSWTHLAFHLFTKVINWSKSTRMDFSTGTSFSKFSPIFMYLERVTHTQKATFGVKKSTSHFSIHLLFSTA